MKKFIVGVAITVVGGVILAVSGIGSSGNSQNAESSTGSITQNQYNGPTVVSHSSATSSIDYDAYVAAIRKESEERIEGLKTSIEADVKSFISSHEGRKERVDLERQNQEKAEASIRRDFEERNSQIALPVFQDAENFFKKRYLLAVANNLKAELIWDGRSLPFNLYHETDRYFHLKFENGTTTGTIKVYPFLMSSTDNRLSFEVSQDLGLKFAVQVYLDKENEVHLECNSYSTSATYTTYGQIFSGDGILRECLNPWLDKLISERNNTKI